MDAKVLSVETINLYLNKSDPPHLAVHAVGNVNSSGLKNGRLIPRMYIRPPQDGIQDFDFITEAPSGFVLWVVPPIEGMGSVNFLDWMKGVRVHASTNSLEALLSDEKYLVKGVTLGGEIPWPLAGEVPWP